MTKSLFSFQDLPPAPKAESGKKPGGVMLEDGNFREGKIEQSVREIVGTDILPGDQIHFVSRGNWSSYDLLLYLLEITGPAEVYFTTWSISELAISKLVEKTKSGHIQRLCCIIDAGLNNRKPKAAQMARANFQNMKMAACHAKVTAIRNEHYSIAVVGSANYTNNPRLEVGTITHSQAAADFHIDWIKQELQ